MNFLKKMRIWHMMTLAAGIPLAAAGFFAFQMISNELTKKNNAEDVQSLVTLATGMSNLVHEQQKERCATAVFLGSKGTKFASEMAAQRKVTNDKRAAYAKILTGFNAKNFEAAFGDKLKGVNTNLARLDGIRSAVDGQTISAPNAIGYFTKLNGENLNVIAHMAKIAKDPVIVLRFSSFVGFLQGKERAGIERAVGANGFAAGRFTPKALNKFKSLISAQASYFGIFKGFATPNQSSAFDQLLQSDPAKGVDRMRAIAVAGGISGELKGVAGGTWFKTITQKINGLKGIENLLAGDIIKDAAGIVRGASTHLALVGTQVAIAFLVAIVLSFFIAMTVGSIFRQVAAAATALAEGDTEVAIPVSDRRDEIGDLWRGMDVLKAKVAEAFRASQMIENMPINVMGCDLENFKINYANKAAQNTVKELESVVPVMAGALIGASIDVFHSDPARQREIISDPSNLPHNEVIEIGGEYLDLTISAVTDAKGNYASPMFGWSVVTDKVKADQETKRLLTMVDQMPVNVMTLDPQGLKINYANQTSKDTLKRLEQHLSFKADDVIGQGVDIFQKNGEQENKLPVDQQNLPYEGNIKLGNESLNLKVDAITDDKGTYIGPMLSWQVLTEQVDMATRVREIVESVAASSTQLKATAETMTATAEQSNQQAASVAASSEEAPNNVQTVASAAEELSASINEISSQVAQSSTIAGKAVEETQRTNETVQSLADGAQKIGEVVNLINDIAEQTNLLALNATIEAARAGEAGKGFAVVASEVKSLATQTAKATDEIGSQITSMQTVTEDAVTAIKSISATIEEINQIAGGIASAVEEQGAATQEIARNVQEASKGTQDVSQNIAGVTEAAQETGRSAADLLNASNELSQQGNQLQTEIEAFVQKVRSA
jgi:methyl-accepting chemotaxis protein